MKTTISSLCIALVLTLGASNIALADHNYRGGYYNGNYGGPPRHHYHDGGYSRGSGWAGPAAVLAIAGIAAGIAASTYYSPPPPPVYVQQPQQPVYIEAPQPAYVAPQPGYWRYREY
jgi:hypothetical protein